jgi:nucleotide-binding universal stress UspA family protein
MPSAGSIFGHLLVGVDGSEPAFEACRQAARLADPGAVLDAAAVVHLVPGLAAATDQPGTPDRLKLEAEAALDEAAHILGKRTRKRFLNGAIAAALIDEIHRSGATLLALGTHGHRRMTEILIGGPAGDLLHTAPCSVLIARPVAAIDAFPRSIVVGLDASPEADQALTAAHHLAARFDSRVRVITALKGTNVDLRQVHLRTPFAQAVDQHPVTALVEASNEADLVIVGSRALNGLRALGSVSERIAHQAVCSVLVVRLPARIRRATFSSAEWELLCLAPT